MMPSLTSVSYGYLYFSTCNQKQDSRLQSNTEQGRQQPGETQHFMRVTAQWTVLKRSWQQPECFLNALKQHFRADRWVKPLKKKKKKMVLGKSQHVWFGRLWYVSVSMWVLVFDRAERVSVCLGNKLMESFWNAAKHSTWQAVVVLSCRLVSCFSSKISHAS